jgi:DnaJ-class molecular chaperone
MEDKDPIICPYCNGAGFHPYNPNWRCHHCHGTGHITEDCEDDRYAFCTEDNATDRYEAAYDL